MLWWCSFFLHVVFQFSAFCPSYVKFVFINLMFMDPCIIVQFIKKIQQDATMYQNFIIPYLYEAQHVSGDTLPIIRSLKLHWQPPVFHMWKVVGRVSGGRCQAQAWQRPPTTRPTTFHVWKTRGCQCSFRLLMMVGVSPEKCWVSYKYGIIKFLIHCCILLDFSLWIKRMYVRICKALYRYDTWSLTVRENTDWGYYRILCWGRSYALDKGG